MSKKFILIVMLLLISNIMFAEEVKEKSLITVTGVGQVVVVPDTAIVTLGAITKNDSAKEAFSENREIMKKIFDSLSKIGIEQKDIKTNDYSAYMEQNYSKSSNSNSKPGKFVVVNNIIITIKDMEKMGDVINTAFENGANQMYGISFIAKNNEEAKIESRKKSIKDAREKADTLAKEAGVKIIGVYRITENGGYRGEYIAEKSMGAVSNVISSGTTTISTSTEVQYIIE